MIGVPEEQRDLLWRWSRVLIRTLDLAPSLEVYVEADRVAHEAFGFFGNLVDERRAHPAEDLLSRLIAAHDQEEGKLTEEELIVMCTLLLIAGFDTTVNLIGNGMLALLQHPQERERLQRQPELMPSALRLDAHGVLESGPRVLPACFSVGEKLLRVVANRPAGRSG